MKKSKLGDKSIYVGRVSSLIKREIAVLFGKMNASLLKNMTVIDVDVLPDLSVSKIFVTFSDQNVEKNEHGVAKTTYLFLFRLSETN